MELKTNYFKLTFNNGHEYFVVTDTNNIDTFLKSISEESFVTLQLKESDPVHIVVDNLFSVQVAREGVIGAQTKLWRLLS